jgi:hypothetical protein
MSASYPGSAKTFVSRNAGDVIQPAHVNDLQDEVNAIETALVAGPTFPTVTLSSGQIVFPAVQNASAGANTLDDYEEGTWTPSLGGTATYTTQAGTYTKVGRLVFVQGHLVVNVIGTGSTGIISGLPFAASTPVAGSVGFFASAANTFVFVSCLVSGSTILIETATAATLQMAIAVFFGNGTDIYFSATYFV